MLAFAELASRACACKVKNAFASNPASTKLDRIGTHRAQLTSLATCARWADEPNCVGLVCARIFYRTKRTHTSIAQHPIPGGINARSRARVSPCEMMCAWCRRPHTCKCMRAHKRAQSESATVHTVTPRCYAIIDIVHSNCCPPFALNNIIWILGHVCECACVCVRVCTFEINWNQNSPGPFAKRCCTMNECMRINLISEMDGMQYNYYVLVPGAPMQTLKEKYIFMCEDTINIFLIFFSV